jgi:hypothetical protein
MESFDYIKDPADVLDYTLDWSAWLGTDTISTSTFVVETGLTAGVNSKTTTATTIWLSGGTNDNVYQVANTIVTAAGRTIRRVVGVKVQTNE